jgi:hypothetical protein
VDRKRWGSHVRRVFLPTTDTHDHDHDVELVVHSDKHGDQHDVDRDGSPASGSAVRHADPGHQRDARFCV